MQNVEQLRVLLFLSAVAIVYVLAAGVSVRWALQRFQGRSYPSSPMTTAARRLVVIAALAGILCFAYGYFVEPYWIEVTRVEIRSAKLAPMSRPIRIVHISDLHCDPNPRLEPRLPEIIAREEPDIIVFTGDSANSRDGLPVLKQLMSSLAAIAPTYVVKGNWDTRYGSFFEGTGVNEMDGSAAAVTVESSQIWIAGVAASNQGLFDSAISQAPPEAFTIFLNHYPDLILEVAERKVDLYCAGHTHGGQVALPFYGALITFSKFGKRFESGLYRVNETWMYVNRGIGMEGGSAPRVRFCARPEVTVINVIPQS